MRKGEWAADLRQPGPEDLGGGVDVPQLVQDDLNNGLALLVPAHGLQTIYQWMVSAAVYLRAGYQELDNEGVRAWFHPADAIETLRNDINLRAEMGAAKYGCRLHTRNGRDAMLDAYQEILDALSYVRQELTERGEHPLS